MFEISPASLAQVVRGRGGVLMEVESDVQDIARRIKEIDSSLHLMFNERTGIFIVYQTLEDGSEHLVTTCTELDARLVERLRKVCSPQYDFAAEVERQDELVDRETERRFREQVGEVGERLAHAIRSDVFGGDTGTYFFGGGNGREEQVD